MRHLSLVSIGLAKRLEELKGCGIMKLGTLSQLVLRSWEIHFRRVFGLSPRPYKFLFELTDHCNSKCQTCGIWKTEAGWEKKELSLNVAEMFLKDYGQDLLWIALSGGEPTIYREFSGLIDLIRKYCPQLRLITFTTNGLLPKRALACAEELRQLHCEVFLTISLDGDEKTHDEIRGVRGNYKLAKQTYELLKDRGFQAYFGLTLSELNQEWVRNQSNQLRDIKAVTFTHSGGIYRQNNSIQDQNLLEMLRIVIQHYRIQSLSEFSEWMYLRLGKTFISRGRRLPLPCEVISTSLHVKANGDVSPCMFLKPIGNLQSSGIRSILKNPNLRTQIEQIRKGHCPRCWMNCYAPHSILQNPLRALYRAFSI